MKNLLYLIIGIFFTINIYASHTIGGNLTYTCVGTNPTVLQLNMSIYVDCPYPFNGGQFSLTNDCGLVNPAVGMVLVDSTRMTPFCMGVLSTCDGGAVQEYIKYEYTTNITLPDTCDSWTIIFNYCCRPSVSNTVFPGELHYETTVNTTAFSCDNSPLIGGIEIPYFCSGQSNNYCVTATDVDGDSLSYELVANQGSGGGPIPYVPPYTVGTPISNINFDPGTGCFSFNESVSGVYMIAVRVHSWRNGNHIGYVTQDFPVIVYACGGNNIPNGSIQSVTGAIQTGQNTIDVCVNSSFCFDIAFVDVDANDTLTYNALLSNLTMAYTGSTVIASGINPLIINVCWTPTNLGFYSATSTVTDNFCLINGIGTFTSIVHVDVCSGVSKQNSFGGLNVYPSPKTINESMIVEFDAIFDETMTIKIIDVSGKEIYSQEKEILVGGNKIVITEKLPKGLLLIQLKTINSIITKKIIVD